MICTWQGPRNGFAFSIQRPANKFLTSPSFKEVSGSASGRSESVQFIVDGHVHLYSVQHAAEQILAAFSRLRAAAGNPDRKPVMPTLLVLDTSKNRVFSRLCDSCPSEADDGLIRSQDDQGLLMVKNRELEGLLVGGIQFAASEGFEVIGIGCNIPARDHRPAAEIIAEVRSANGLAILPWAFGKWIGSKGRALDHVLDSHDSASLILGDNALRPAPSPKPRQFLAGEKSGRPVLPGSDPLPLDGDAGRIGSYGFAFDGELACELPVESFVDQLVRLRQQPRIIGQRLGWAEALLMQLRLRVEKRLQPEA